MGTQHVRRPPIEVVKTKFARRHRPPYFAKAWYSNVRKSIGTAKKSSPAHLIGNLWQGPPRASLQRQRHPYNWHWFRNYGTGETLNNGTVTKSDVCRWASRSTSKRVTSSGGRYQFKDDWQFYDTLVTSFEYEDARCPGGQSCQGMKYYNRDRGSLNHGNHGNGSRRSRRYKFTISKETKPVHSKPAAQRLL